MAIVIHDYTVTVADIPGGHRLTATRGSEVQTVDVMSNSGGGTGGDGADGFSPIIEITEISGGHRLTVTDVNGTESFDVLDGAPGKTAYQYAQDGGYTGSEADFAAKLAKEIPDGVVLFTPQALTDDQQTQARGNIGAAADSEVKKMQSDQPNLFAKTQTGNLLDVTTLTDGGYINSLGEVAARDGYVYSDYIDITKAVGDWLVMYTCPRDNVTIVRTFYRMCFYDGNKNKIAYYEANGISDSTKAYVEIPAQAVYVRTSFIKQYDTWTYQVVRGAADTPIAVYEYNPVFFTVVPANLEDKLAVIDELAKSKHQDDAEFTVTKLNNSLTYSENDITFVKDELWMMKDDATYINGTKIFRYKVVDGEFTLVGDCDCDFGHLNVMDYCAANDCLLFSHYSTETTGNYFTLVKNPLALGATALEAEVGIRYDVDVGYKVVALWGGSNLGSNNIVYLLSNDSQVITKILLLKDDSGEFNGEYVTLETYESEAWGVQGADIFGDTLYIGGQVNSNEYAAVKEISLSDPTQSRIVKRKFYADDGTAIDGCVQGIYVDKDSVWLCINSGDASKPVCLTKYNR